MSLKKLSNRRIAVIVENETLECAMEEKISFVNIEDPELALLWKKASILRDVLTPIESEIYDILRAAESEEE